MECRWHWDPSAVGHHKHLLRHKLKDSQRESPLKTPRNFFKRMGMDNNKARVTVREHECLFNVVRTILYLLRWANLPLQWHSASASLTTSHTLYLLFIISSGRDVSLAQKRERMLVQRKFISQYTTYLMVRLCNHSNRWLTKNPAFVTGCTGLAKDMAERDARFSMEVLWCWWVL